MLIIAQELPLPDLMERAAACQQTFSMRETAWPPTLGPPPESGLQHGRDSWTITQSSLMIWTMPTAPCRISGCLSSLKTNQPQPGMRISGPGPEGERRDPCATGMTAVQVPSTGANRVARPVGGKGLGPCGPRATLVRLVRSGPWPTSVIWQRTKVVRSGQDMVLSVVRLQRVSGESSETRLNVCGPLRPLVNYSGPRSTV